MQLESTPTLGSIESTVYEKKCYAKKSLAFNLKNANFRELFPEICEEINKRLQGQQQAAAGAKAKSILNNNSASGGVGGADCTDAAATAANSTAALANAATNTNNTNNNNAANANKTSNFNWQSIYSNLIIIISFAIFALIVNYVLKNLNQE